MVVVEAASDAELIARVRGGDLEAYAQLYGRHVEAARALARRCTRSAADADDLVAQAFEAVLGALQRGNGPDEAFRAYLFTTIRRSAARQQSSKVAPSDEGDLDSVEPFIDPAIAGLERSLVARAFLTLPERWQTVLWHTEIEGQSPAEVAEIVGLRPNAVAALAYRAREGLRQAYLQLHIAEAGPEHQATVDKLGAYARDALSPAEKAKVEAHLDECERCKAAYLEMTDVNAALVRSVAPLFLGAGAAGYLTAGAAKIGVAGGGVILRLLRKLRQPAVAGGVAAATAVAVAAAALGLNELASDDKPPDPVEEADAPPAGSNNSPPTIGPTQPPTTPPPSTEPPQVPGEEIPIIVVTTTTARPRTTTTTTTTEPTTTTTTEPPTTTTTTTTTTLPPSADLDLSGEIGLASAEVNAINLGPNDVPDAIVVIVLENGTFTATPNGGAWSCTRESNTRLVCAVPPLAAGATSTESVAFIRMAGFQLRVRISSATVTDPDQSNNCGMTGCP